MLAVVQRVSSASVTVGSDTRGRIGFGLVVLLAVEHGDNQIDVEYLVQKIVEMRIFNDQNQKLNKSLLDIQGSLLIISQFTLLGDTRKGRRPSYHRAAGSAEGERLYQEFISTARRKGCPVETGVFGAMMQVALVNDGPVTIIIDSRRNYAPDRTVTKQCPVQGSIGSTEVN
ncbi:D-tyrosyl-tRNA(Tyr) deacylase [bacterium]|nr:D-tyrosyl-tRNA(Tyr) deacylase [candidate division CSSED10-310 bacterium]